ncbi:MAG: molecular chaperone HtpG [Ruminococcaceae bacterium]|nr:molecular chaperone HtpG [Oscillospiraceae bacterium]
MDNKFEKGGISVQTEHIFPIIKRWLYSDKEIFLRELVSNASDAITKYRRLVSLNEATDDGASPRIDVIIDKDNKTLTVKDNGIGMSSDEIKKYINQIALSGALEFIQKYDDEKNESGIIGHFGLGFYSAFMVADTVDIKTKSFVESEKAAFWTCNEAGEFSMGEGDKAERGTEVILHVNDDEKDFLDTAKLRSILDKYCSFMPIEIYFTEVGKEPEKNEDGTEKPLSPINDTQPLWQKSPSECKDEDYKDFYKKLFNDYREPLFQVHINADYPLNFKGIIYFPRLMHEYENLEGQIKLYYNQVFVADNIKEVIPEYLMMLKGVLDCPELPLNVSRSYLQNNGYVSKISAHIIKKIADKLNSLFNTERENYESFWDDIKPFIEYGCMRDKKFFDRVKDIILFKTTDGKYVTRAEYAEGKIKDKIYYATDAVQQNRYIELLKSQDITVVMLNAMIDQQFISFLEKEAEMKFVRVDSDMDDALKSENDVTENEILKDFFKEALDKKDMEVKCEMLKDENIPAVILLSEQQRRFADMMKMYSRNDIGMPPMPTDEKLVINMASSLIKKVESMIASADGKEKAAKIAKQIYMLAVISQRSLTVEEMNDFISSSQDILLNS